MNAKPNERDVAGRNAIENAAAMWLARRDRGLSPAEQDEYMQWLAADRRHAEILAQHAAAFGRMMRLYEWQPGHSADANPDLFAPPPRWRWHRWGCGLAAVATLTLMAAIWRPSESTYEVGGAAGNFLRVNERQALPDGSIAELKDGSQIEVIFSAHERRVKVSGEAHFDVARSTIPFVVQAGGVDVQAVGTAFNVRADPDAIDILVTEGKVTVRRTVEDTGAGLEWPGFSSGETGTNMIVAGQRAHVPTMPAAGIRVRQVSAAETQAALAWKVPRLQFFETPLAVAVEEFNRRNRVRIVLEQRELGAVPIGGTFRIDNVESFVRLVEVTLDLRAVRQGEEKILLTRKREAPAR